MSAGFSLSPSHFSAGVLRPLKIQRFTHSIVGTPAVKMPTVKIETDPWNRELKPSRSATFKLPASAGRRARWLGPRLQIPDFRSCPSVLLDPQQGKIRIESNHKHQVRIESSESQSIRFATGQTRETVGWGVWNQPFFLDRDVPAENFPPEKTKQKKQGNQTELSHTSFRCGRQGGF